MLCYNNTIPYCIRRKEDQTMAKENAILDKEEQVNEDLAESFDFDALEEKLQSQLEEEIADMQFLAEEKKKSEVQIISAMSSWMLYGSNS